MAMKDRNLMGAGVMAVLLGICCAAPLLVVAIGAARVDRLARQRLSHTHSGTHCRYGGDYRGCMEEMAS
jgi:hypothetical protein